MVRSLRRQRARVASLRWNGIGAFAGPRASWQQAGMAAPTRTHVQRITLCAWRQCRAPLFSVCANCDAGRRRYCSAECVAKARHRSVREAGCRYQKTEQGRARHVARQARYRARQQASVANDQGERVDDVRDAIKRPKSAIPEAQEPPEAQAAPEAEAPDTRRLTQATTAGGMVTPIAPADSARHQKCQFCGRPAYWLSRKTTRAPLRARPHLRARAPRAGPAL